MDEKPWAVAALDDDEPSDSTVAVGPLGSLVEREIDPVTVESAETGESLSPSRPANRSTEYATGTKEHDDDREA